MTATKAGLRPYPAYKDSELRWLGSIPAHWDERRAKYFLREVDERSTTGTEELLSVSHVTGVTPRSQKNVTMFKAASYIGHKICRPADLVINTMWAWMAALGVAKETGIVSPSYAVYRPRFPDAFIPAYLDLLLRTEPFRSQYVGESTGIRGSRLRLYPEQFLRIPISCPPLSEQEQMLAFLRAADGQIAKLIRAKQRLIELLNERKQAIVQRAVTRGLDPNVRVKPSGVPWLGDVPEHWQTKKMKWLASFSPSRSEASAILQQNERVTFLPMECIGTDGSLDASQLRPVADVWQGFTYFRRNDVVVAKITPCFENGKGAYLGALPTEYGFGTTELIVMRAMSEILPEYLYLLTTLKIFRIMGTESMTGAAGQQRVPVEFIRDFIVPLPSSSEQRAILSSLSRETEHVSNALDRTRREIALLREYRMCLVADVVTGKLDVRGVPLPAEHTDAAVTAGVFADEVAEEDEMTDTKETPDAGE